MHNSRPHFWPTAAGGELYARMARLAHAVIHHSEWGMREITAALPYRDDAIHAVIPHGHYATELTIHDDRSECERQLGLAPCALRFGVIGRPQSEKRVPDVADAFLAGAGADRQLLVGAVAWGETFPADPRLVIHPRSRWLTREKIAMQVKCCDCLVAWHGGGSYLTSGLVADAIGAGIPMLVNGDWGFWRAVLGDAALTYVGKDGLAEAFATMMPSDIARGANAAKTLRSAYDWNRVAQETAGLFVRTGHLRTRQEQQGEKRP
jgi:hypothetical protein